MSVSPTEVWITGIGLISSLGEGLEDHWQALTADKPKPIVDETSFAPYTIHPICKLDYSLQIPKRGDLRQMEDWQRIGTYAAGLALDDAGIKDDEELLAKIHIIAAAANGERDPIADAAVLEMIAGNPDWREYLNEQLLKHLRPTLYLAQQTQLLAGNISIVHKVTGGSRTYKGEEIAGVQIVENAVQRIEAGQGDLFLVGASYNAARWDQLLISELNGKGDRFSGSMGVFLVIESKDHAKARGARPYARIKGIDVSSALIDDQAEQRIELENAEGSSKVETPSALFGQGVEAQFALGCALASLYCSKVTTKAVVTGSATAVIEKVVI
ncbi:MAG: beta-ketoacyl-ACP synthase [bacterium]|nr:beta-ketoacyl-ACP synthase [bacterium]